MKGQRWLTICSLWLHFVLFLYRHSLFANCMEQPQMVSSDSACYLFKDRNSCNKAQNNLCRWSESSQKCYPKEVVSHNEENGKNLLRRQLKEVQDCSDVIYRDQCKSLEHCRWCRSEVLDDGCFKALEARRLPFQVFDCSITR